MPAPIHIDGLPVLSFAAYLHWNDLQQLGADGLWTVANVELDAHGKQVTVTVYPGPGPFRCPECEADVQGYHRKLRRRHHLDTCHFTTWFLTEVSRIECPGLWRLLARFRIEGLRGLAHGNRG